MINSVTAAEAAAIATNVHTPGVNLLGQMALRIESNKRGKEILPIKSNDDLPTREFCTFCKRRGHKYEDCLTRTYKKKLEMKNETVLPDDKKNEPGKTKVEPKKFEPTCFICHKKGHIAPNCP